MSRIEAIDRGIVQLLEHYVDMVGVTCSSRVVSIKRNQSLRVRFRRSGLWYGGILNGDQSVYNTVA